jgi:hypothetical protein
LRRKSGFDHREALLSSESLGIRHPHSPPSDGDCRPYGLDNAKWPSPLQKSVKRAERAGACEGEDTPGAAILQGVEDQHGRDCDETEERQRVHGDMDGRRSSQVKLDERETWAHWRAIFAIALLSFIAQHRPVPFRDP